MKKCSDNQLFAPKVAETLRDVRVMSVLVLFVVEMSQISCIFAATMELKVDVDAVLRARLPRHYKWIPRPLVGVLERYICQERLNELLRLTAGKRNSEFARALLKELDVTYEIAGDAVHMPAPGDCAVTYVSNHPLGALDGMCLIDMISRHHGGVEPAFVVNDLLSAVKPLDGVFIPINKHGRQSRGAACEVDAAFADLNRPVIMFPAGMCSRQQTKGGPIRDLVWNKMFVQKSVETGRRIVPLRFEGRNSDSFYRLARRREHLGLKFNIEMLALPREFVGGSGKHFRVVVGEPIETSALERGHGAVACAAKIREYIYTL